MRKRIIYIILGSLLILALILGLWFWFFSGSTGSQSPSNLFGTGGNKTSTSTLTGTGGNGQAPIGSTAGTGVNGGTTDGNPNTETPIVDNTTSNPAGDPNAPFVDVVNNDATISPDIIWNDTFIYRNSSESVFFDPTSITNVADGTVEGTPHITKVAGADGTDISLLSSLGVIIGGCLANYGQNWLAAKGATSLTSLFGVIDKFKVQTADATTNTSQSTETITQCLARTLGRLAVQAITDSVVNWINSGFQGKPSFVQDFKAFFTSVADQAAGEYLQSSNFAFLCSPYQLQVRMAVAQSYARRNDAPSCTLTDAVDNVKGFLGGDFGQGGWGGLVSFTTEPGNNPFGAYMNLNGGLTNNIAQAQSNANLEVNVGNGFLSYKKCDTASGATGQPLGTQASNCKIVTPGAAIESSLTTVFGQSLESLQLGDSINQILAALQNALITKALYGGLSNINSNNSASNTDTKAQTVAGALMTEIQTAVTAAQQYATTEQRIITDVQTAQSNLIELQNCWLTASSSSTLTASQIATAQTGAVAAALKVSQLEAMVTVYNQNIEKANNSIQVEQELQTDLLLATVAADVNSVKATWTTMKSSDTPHIYTATDVTSAQQDRTGMQSNLASINIDTSTKLQQCNALPK